MRYRCNDCSDETCPEFKDFVKLIAAAVSPPVRDVAVPTVPWSVVQAEAVAWLVVRDGRCPYHAALFGAMAIADMRGELVHQAVP